VQGILHTAFPCKYFPNVSDFKTLLNTELETETFMTAQHETHHQYMKQQKRKED
jgi:hypothetical protein